MKDKYLTALPYLLAAVVFAGCLILGFPAFSGFLEVLLVGSAQNALELFACLLLAVYASTGRSLGLVDALRAHGGALLTLPTLGLAGALFCLFAGPAGWIARAAFAAGTIGGALALASMCCRAQRRFRE